MPLQAVIALLAAVEDDDEIIQEFDDFDGWLRYCVCWTGSRVREWSG